MPFFNSPHYRSMETQCCHSKQTEELIVLKKHTHTHTKAVKDNMMNISIKSQTHGANGIRGDNFLTIYFFFSFFGVR